MGISLISTKCGENRFTPLTSDYTSGSCGLNKSLDYEITQNLKFKNAVESSTRKNAIKKMRLGSNKEVILSSLTFDIPITQNGWSINCTFGGKLIYFISISFNVCKINIRSATRINQLLFIDSFQICSFQVFLEPLFLHDHGHDHGVLINISMVAAGLLSNIIASSKFSGWP